MDQQERDDLQLMIDSLPSGGVSFKTINKKRYPYYQWTENGKQHSRLIREDELDALLEQIGERKRLKRMLKELPVSKDEEITAVIRTGNALKQFLAPVRTYRKRELIASLRNYIFGDVSGRVFVLYGLRRTGKTTMIRQVISEMSEEMFSQTAFIQITPSDTLAQINRDLRKLESRGYRYVFLDEVTLIDDFIEGAAVFSDVYAASGMKIVLSGTDSLGFVFSEDEQLYDRCILLHTTFIPYREFEEVLGMRGIDEYIRYGGTMSMGGVEYNAEPTFATKKSTDEYVDSAIAKNIQHSLKNYRYEDHFGSLKELYDKNELTSAINRIVEDINHRFTIEVLTREFRSTDLRLSENNLRSTNDILDRIDKEAVTQRLKEFLEIKNKEEQTIEITEEHRRQIKEYLDLLDLTVDIEIIHMANLNRKEFRTAISQPGMRYAQAAALIDQLMLDETFQTLSLAERNMVTERILNEIKGRMMEDIVLLETKKAKPKCQVFKLQFAVGEFDMVVFDPKRSSCEVYEIKHSKEINRKQYRHLADEIKCENTAFRFGTIEGKYVLYRGDNTSVEGIIYRNVEDYLKALPIVR